MSTSTLARKSRRTARHDGSITPTSSAGVKSKLRDFAAERPTLFEAWICLRGISVPALARAADIASNTVYNLLAAPKSARLATLDAISEAVGLTSEQVRAMVERKVIDPDRVSDEIAEALA